MMNIGETVIPNEDNDEEDLTRCNPSFLPLPAVRVTKGVWLARWTLNDEEKRIVAETGDIYIRMDAVDGDELIMPHRLFVERPDIAQIKNYYEQQNAERNKKVVNSGNVDAEKLDLPKPTF